MIPANRRPPASKTSEAGSFFCVFGLVAEVDGVCRLCALLAACVDVLLVNECGLYVSVSHPLLYRLDVRSTTDETCAVRPSHGV